MRMQNRKDQVKTTTTFLTRWSVHGTVKLHYAFQPVASEGVALSVSACSYKEGSAEF